MVAAITDFAYLQKLEEEYRDKFKNQPPKLLGDIILSQNKVDKIGYTLGNCLRISSQERVEVYPLTISLFLTWASVYYYKGVSFWDPIFEKLGLEKNMDDWNFLGEIFLNTIYSYGLQELPDGKHKKYMTPILMHGYIGEHYAVPLLDYLNAVYSSYLEYDLSEEALARLWADLFNMDQEQARLRDTLDKLREKEGEIKKKILDFQLPLSLNKNSKAQIESLQADIARNKEDVNCYINELLSLSIEKVPIEEASIAFAECFVTLDGVLGKNKEKNPHSFKKINDLFTEVKGEFDSKLQSLKNTDEELNDKLRTAQNALKIMESRKNHLLTEIVKLGNGDLEKGFLVLSGYAELSDELEDIQKQREQREKLFQEETELENSTLRQVFTTSLYNLAKANPGLFQDFIKSSFELIAAYAGNKPLPDNHRFSETVQKWGALPRIRERLHKKEKRGTESAGIRKTGGEPRIGRHLKRTRLRQPNLQYDYVGKQLQIQIPSQEILAPANYRQAPVYALRLKDEEKAINCPFQFERGKLKIDGLSFNLTDSGIKGISLKWYNLHEHWDLTPGPVMVFSQEGKLLDGRQFANGFYYILVENSYKAGPNKIITKYPAGFPGYTAYEFSGRESKLDFYSPEKRVIELTFTRYPDISIQELESLPGLKQDDFAVYKGNPILTIKREFLENTGRDAVLVLNFNGGKLHEESLATLSWHKQTGRGSLSYTLPLKNFVPRYVPTHWQTFELQIISKEGEIYFEDAFCLLRGFSLKLEEGILKIKLPGRSRLKNEKSERIRNEYCIPFDNSSEVTFQVYFDRIGWKNFSVQVPYIRWEVYDEAGEMGVLPLILLQSETDFLKKSKIKIQSASSVTNRVILADDQDYLVQKFNIRDSKLEIKLESFSDLFTNRDKTAYIQIYCEGELGSTKTENLAEVYAGIELDNVELFCSEQEEEYLFELSFTTEYPNLDHLHFRCYTDEGDELFSRQVRANPDYFYIDKAGLTAISVNTELYYTEKITSIFGDNYNQKVCWKGLVSLPNLKGIYQKLKEDGLVLTGFTYNDVYYKLSGSYQIKDIFLSSRNFEGEELLSGNFIDKKISTKVYFYVEYVDDKALISVLWDEEEDALQYDPTKGTLEWEVREGKHIMGPLENLEFDFLGSDEK